MPILGLVVGRIAGTVIGAWAGYAGIVFLFAAGILLLRPGRDEEQEEKRLRLLAHARGLAIIDLGLGISVDELTIGFSAGLIALPIALTVIWIAFQAFAAAQIGLRSHHVAAAREIRQRGFDDPPAPPLDPCIPPQLRRWDRHDRP